ncbi:MAG TPA: hydroxymethylglutaryl-CoA reductase, degradative [Alloiococcus sp.]|nr:hydroxymethylglutaryl-CoA reductase, degradative [Alloiococcus sp.]
MNSKLDKFYKKSYSERLTALLEAEVITKEQYGTLVDTQLNLDATTGVHMIENYIANYTLPYGLAFNFLVNNRVYIVPMAVEEPSVIAAASNGAKIIANNGGFKTTVHNREMIGQVVVKQSSNIEKDKEVLEKNKEKLINLANEAYPSIVKRGGGATRAKARIVDGDIEEAIDQYLVFHLHVDTQEAMGANMINTMLEAIAPTIESLVTGKVLMSILTNLATESLVTATCELTPKTLVSEGFSGEDVRDRIAEASKYAYVDPYRAATNNKGIMNGLDAVIVATGNDWRAIEAGAHAYSVKDGQYRSLTKWRVNEAGNLTGELTLPLPIATVGGSIGYHPGAQFSKAILGNPTAKELAKIMVSVGLAQNLAALKALSTSGIQKGHMALQAKSLAINAGAVGKEIDKVTEMLIKNEKMNLNVASDFLKQIK